MYILLLFRVFPLGLYCVNIYIISLSLSIWRDDVRGDARAHLHHAIYIYMYVLYVVCVCCVCGVEAEHLCKLRWIHDVKRCARACARNLNLTARRALLMRARKTGWDCECMYMLCETLMDYGLCARGISVCVHNIA